MRVALFPTCVVDAVSPDVGVATVRVLRRLGHDVTVPHGATCCGQPAWNAGQVGPAARVAATTLAALDGASCDAVVVPAGSCTTMIKVFWPELFELAGEHDAVHRARRLGPRVREFSEFVAAQETDQPAEAAAGPATPVVYHHSCHMLRELRIHDQPEALLRAAGHEPQPTEAAGRCCGFGGLFSVKLPETSTAMADEVLDAAGRTGAETVVACDSSCLLQLRGRAEQRGLPLRFRHLAQVLEDGS